MSGLVRLVGVGPGQPGLLTLQAAAAIRDADAVRHPKSCEPAVLAHARPGADVAPYEGAQEVARLAREGRRVAVLFAGDPYGGGEGVELALHLERAGVDFEALPGLPAELAGPTLSGVPLAVEGRSGSVQLGLRREGETLVLRLAAGWWESGLKALLEAGFAPETRAALVLRPGAAGQDRMEGSLAELQEVTRRSADQPEAVVVIGPGVELAGRLDTLTRRPLHGKRVLVTRPRHQLEPFRTQLSELGADVVHIPTIEIRPLPAGAAIERAIELLPETALVIFTSANAVEVFFDRLFEAGRDARALHSSRVCAIGSETAHSLEGRGVRADLVAAEYTAEGLGAALQDLELEGARVLVPRARVARDALPAHLAERGAEVEVLPVYETACPNGATAALRGLFEQGGASVVTFTSSSTVSNFVRAFEEGEAPGRGDGTRVACLGPVTAETARRLGLRVDIIAREYTTRGLALAIAEAIG